MKKFKFLTLMTLCGVMALSVLGGCGSKSNLGDPSKLSIGIVKKGYGSAFVYELANAYMSRHPEADIEIVYDTPNDDWVGSTVEMGEMNNIDIYFDISFARFRHLTNKTLVPGYSPLFADLSDVYNAPAVGYKETEADPNLTNKDIFNSYAVDSSTLDADGKQYFVPWALGMCNIMYNKTAWDAANAKLGNNPLELPKTSTEMFTLFDRIKNDASIEPAPFKYFASGAGYMFQLFLNWWSQYDGPEVMANFKQGKDAAGNYTDEIFLYNNEGQMGRTRSYEALHRMLTTPGWASEDDKTASFTDGQLSFIYGDAFFHVNGDWLEREASEQVQPGEADLCFIKTPVISEIVEKWPTVFNGSAAENDRKLSAVVAYVDGEADTCPIPVDSDAYKGIKNARNTVVTEAPLHIAYVPAYSKHIDEAKDFFKFMLSKEGQEIMMVTSFGNMCPLTVDPTQFNFYNENPDEYRLSDKATYMAKSKMDIFCSPDTVLTGNVKKHPINYLTSFELRPFATDPEVAFAINGKSVQDYMNNEYTLMHGVWDTILRDAGIQA